MFDVLLVRQHVEMCFLNEARRQFSFKLEFSAFIAITTKPHSAFLFAPALHSVHRIAAKHDKSLPRKYERVLGGGQER